MRYSAEVQAARIAMFEKNGVKNDFSHVLDVVERFIIKKKKIANIVSVTNHKHDIISE